MNGFWNGIFFYPSVRIYRMRRRRVYNSRVGLDCSSVADGSKAVDAVDGIESLRGRCKMISSDLL